MHYHLEVIMPPVDNPAKALEQILKPFSEQDEENRHTFWDWYVIGGRYASSHLTAHCDPEKLDAFYDKIRELEITVSGVRAGKPTLQPATQVPTVDSLWREFFPNYPGKRCPLFSNSHDQYTDATGEPDITTLSNLSPNQSAYRVIFAVPKHNSTELRAEEMCSIETWNGVSFQKCAWDGKVASALADYRQKISTYSEEFKALATPGPNWLVVTVDYHC